MIKTQIVINATSDVDGAPVYFAPRDALETVIIEAWQAASSRQWHEINS